MNRLFTLFIILFNLSACSSSGGRAPVSDIVTHQSTTSKASKASYKKDTYIVEKGDTLYSIAWRAGIDVKTLIKRNNFSSPYIIYEGQVVKIKLKKSTIHNKNTKVSVVSQKNAKKSQTRCTGQSCNKNNSKKVVNKKTKEYSAPKVANKSPPTTINKKVSSWNWPVKGKLTKTFSASQAGMKGISLANKRGTAVYAAATGQVVYAGSGLRGYGNLIIIKHTNDYLSAYAHNEKILVRENELIKVGKKIATMGDSGTDSVRLHFEIRYRGKSVDPLRYLPSR